LPGGKRLLALLSTAKLPETSACLVTFFVHCGPENRFRFSFLSSRNFRLAYIRFFPEDTRRIVIDMFTGTYTAIVTPFTNGQIDTEALRKLIVGQIKGGVDGIVPMGTTGESPTLSCEEHMEVIKLAVKFAAGKIKVLAGTGANSTSEAIELTQAAEKVGVDGSLQVAPYYNKPSQEGLFQHFMEVSRATKLPLVLYSIPGRCGVEIGVETVRRLAAATPRIVGIKEAGGNADRVSQLRAALGNQFTILSGDDSLTLPFMAVGAQGVISVASNIIPKQVSEMVNAFLQGNPALALKLHQTYYPLFKDLFVETNPVPVKTALSMLGQMSADVRLPLVPISSKSREILEASMRKCGLLN
jgi:4-hydroxy-tetrahydrodipicolinate synthase